MGTPSSSPEQGHKDEGIDEIESNALNPGYASGSVGWGSMPNKKGQKQKRDVWLRGGEKERMHGDLQEVRESMKGHLRLRLRSKGSPLLREVVISSCLLGERKLPDHLFQPDSERSLSNER
ncbi:hypothetical protein H5410_017792 [Solanum commersonii]|uniref:Uncharacterized protein n=1 Tax=Solanum commersonii TaxID=4109 RepID=A0A9J6A0H0_SOLCO|nr:hypothetical protein H5410_017792 [Solanum commersonii]